MRVSREMTKERLLETIQEVLDDIEEGYDYVSTEQEAEEVTDAVWELLGELDDEDDLGVSRVIDEEGEEINEDS